MTKESLQDLAAFMNESGIANYNKCLKFERVKEAAQYMRMRYLTLGELSLFEYQNIANLRGDRYLRFKVMLTLLVAESEGKDSRQKLAA